MHTTVRRTVIRVQAATLGPPSPLPRFTPLRTLPFPDVGPGATPEMLERIGYGRLESPLPYPVQEDYDRSLREVELPAYVLDNGVLQRDRAADARRPGLVVVRRGSGA